MHPTLRRHPHQLRRHALATAATALLLALPSLPVQAQFYTFNGAVGGYPVDPFPTLNPLNPVFNATGSVLSIGSGATGSFSALAGAQLTADGLSYGDGLGSGSGTISGPGTLVKLTGAVNRLQVGNWGSGDLTVSGGAIVDATLNTAPCAPPGSGCGNYIGNGAGSTALLTITGAGTEVRTARYFGVGQASVFTGFGTPGDKTEATVNIVAGAVLSTGQAGISTGPSGPAALGSEKTLATVLIDGVGSAWIATRDAVRNLPASMSLATHANATAKMDISGGGLLRIDGSGSPGPYDGLSIGNRGQATLTVTGAGSKIETVGDNPFINVGVNSTSSVGTLSIEAGASVTSLYMNVGRFGGTGTLVVKGTDGTGTGSQLTLSGVGVPYANTDATGAPAGIAVGRDGGTGHWTVSDGGLVLITDGGGDGRPSTFSPGVSLGRDAGSTGTLTITGPGSKVEIIGTSLGLAPGQPDNYNPFMQIGRGSPSTTTGALLVADGGKLILTGKAVSMSTTTGGRLTSLNIGGRGLPRAPATCTDCSGNGTATVTGLGSEIIVQGYDAYIGVGRNAGSSGVLQVLAGGKVSSTSLLVGAGASGAVILDAGAIVLSGYRTDSSQVGAGSTIGREAGGAGVLSLSNGSSMTLLPSVLTGGMSIGGDQFASGGTGTVSLSGGSSLTFAGATTSSLRIGRSGSGTMSLSGASQFDAGAGGTAYVADTAGGSGLLSVSSGSLFKADEIGIGGFSDTIAGGAGIANVSGAGSELSVTGPTGFISVGRSAVGTLSLSNQAKVDAIVMNVGRAAGAVGTLSVDHATIALSGQQTGGQMVGAAFSVGNRGGNGFASLSNGSLLSVSNLGSAGASINLGGTPINALGTGTLVVDGGSQVKLVANAGLGTVRVGHDGKGTATFSGASLLDAPGNDVIIAGVPGSTATLTLNSGSVLNADYVGVGSNRGGIDGGIGKLYVNDSTVNATTVEVGTLSLLGGSNGLINGLVIVRGELSPGNSPGRITINGGVRMDGPGRLTIQVIGNGSNGYDFDQLVLTQGSSYAFGGTVSISFLGGADPQAFAAAGLYDMDTFLRSTGSGGETGLSSTFGPGQDWSTVLADATLTQTTSSGTKQLKLDPGGVLTPVPEPATWALWLGGIGMLLAWRRRAGVAAAVA